MTSAFNIIIMGITLFILCSTQWLFWHGSRWLALIYTIVDSVADKLKNMDMAVFCLDKNSELVTFTESKLGSVSIILVYYINTSEIPSELPCENFIWKLHIFTHNSYSHTKPLKRNINVKLTSWTIIKLEVLFRTVYWPRQRTVA